MERERITEVLQRWYRNGANEDELTDKQEKIRARLEFAYEQLKKETSLTVRNLLQKRFNISKNQALTDIQDAKELFSPLNRTDADFLEVFLIEDIKQLIFQARSTGDNSVRLKAQNNLMKIYLAKLNKQSEIDPSKLGGNTFVINVGNNCVNIDALRALPENNKQSFFRELFADVTDIKTVKEIMKS